MDFPIENGDFPSFFVGLPEGSRAEPRTKNQSRASFGSKLDSQVTVAAEDLGPFVFLWLVGKSPK